MAEAKVGIVMGSDSDFSIMEGCAKILDKFGIKYEMVVASAHRTPYKALEYAQTAEERGLQVIIAGAGAAAHLGGVLAAATVLPVIGVPINATPLAGVDALYAMVQMPSGIPVATMAINGAKNAGIFAVQILAAHDPALRQKLHEYKDEMAAQVEEKNKNVQSKLQA